MAHTKRKRRSKHRGNAAGSIEQRGRTGRRAEAAEPRKGSAARGARTLKPPTWRGALIKAAMMSLLLFALTRFGLFGEGVPVSQSAVLALFAILMYTPLAFLTDRWAYGRQQRRLAARR